MTSRAQTVFSGGTILTMEPENPVAEALAIGPDGRILAVGRESEVKILARTTTRQIDLQGKTLLPGFFDCHMHILPLGLALMQVDLSPSVAKSVDDIVRLLRKRLEEQPDAPCILGNRYDHNRFVPPVHPTRYDLDKVCTDRPVRIEHTSGHAAVVNSHALKLLNITRETPDPIGGTIVRDAQGEPNGVLLETASWQNLDKIIPPPTRSQQIEALKLANRYLIERGITSASDANTLPEEIEVYAQAVRNKALQVRVNGMIAWPMLCAPPATTHHLLMNFTIPMSAGTSFTLGRPSSSPTVPSPPAPVGYHNPSRTCPTTMVSTFTRLKS